MRAVLIGVREDDDAVVLELGQVEILADARAQRGDDRAEFLVGQHLIEPLLLGVQGLAAQGKDRLEAAVTALLGAAAGRIALDDIQLVARKIAARAGAQLAHQRRGLELALLPGDVARLSSGFADTGGLNRLFDNAGGGVLVLEIVHVDRQLLGGDGLDQRTHLGVAQPSLGLAFELRVVDVYGDDGGNALAEIVAGEVVVLLLEQPHAARVIVEHLGDGGLEAGLVGAALGRGDVVDEGEEVLVVGIGILDRRAQPHAVALSGECDHVGDGRFVVV